MGERRNCSKQAISHFPTVFSTCMKNFLPFLSESKVSSANSFSLEEFVYSLLTGWIIQGENNGFGIIQEKQLNSLVRIFKCKNYLPYPIPTQWHLLTLLRNKPFENTVGKGEIAHNEQFLLFPQCFLPVWIPFSHFHQIWNCRLQTLSNWKSLKFVVW